MAKGQKASTARKQPNKGRPESGTQPTSDKHLNELHAAVGSPLAGATDLRSFLDSAGELTSEERKLIVRQALILIEQNYAHLPLKRAMHSVDPVQRLKLLLRDIELPGAQLPEGEFHREMTDIFTSLRDLHTNYLLPEPFNNMVALLPIIVESYFDGGNRKYLVTRVDGPSHPTFKPGVEVVYWNGVPMERAVWNYGQRYGGSNLEARHARGVLMLTARALIIAPPPDEEWVIVGYRTTDGKLAEVRLNWQVRERPPSGAGAERDARAGVPFAGLDLELDIVQRMRLSLFAPKVVEAARTAAAKVARGEKLDPLESRFPDIFKARPVKTPSGTFGYLRIRHFDHWPPEDFVGEFIRLIAALPQSGLILDVRGNGGGTINNGELILQTMTPRWIEPEPFQFLNTQLNLEICRRNGPDSNWDDLSAWVQSLEQALKTGAVHSAGYPITNRNWCNEIGQKYFGPVVAITDALCYSTTDMFAAGFQDHGIGPILGTDGNTGAGGANVWEHHYLPSDILPGSVYQPLPKGAGMRVAIRRSLRVGGQSGAPLEDLGVVPDERHLLTRNDLLADNVDLINKAGAILATLPVRSLTVNVESPLPTEAKILAKAQGMTRLDFYLDNRPIQSSDIRDGQVTSVVSKPGAAEALLELQGFDGTEFVARYYLKV